jgi:hypothetical protein
MTKQIEISAIEVLALKKLALINGALTQMLPVDAAREQRALLGVLIEVISRAELANATAA